jgi:hypothetical protein
MRPRIGDVHIVDILWRYRNGGRLREATGLAEILSGTGELLHAVIARVGDPQITLPVYCDTARIRKLPVARARISKAEQEGALCIAFRHPIVTLVDHSDKPLRIHGNAFRVLELVVQATRLSPGQIEDIALSTWGNKAAGRDPFAPCGV